MRKQTQALFSGEARGLAEAGKYHCISMCHHCELPPVQV